MAQAQGLVLTQVSDLAGFHIGGIQDLSQLGFALFIKLSLKRWRPVKIVLKRVFSAGSDKNKVFDTGRARLINGILHQWSIYEGHDLFGD